MDLFTQAHEDRMEKQAPLANRMRPRTLDEYAGQDHIVGPGRLLRRSIQADQLGSLIFYGPPGTGKTTLAEVIANTTTSHFIKLNAVLAGVKDIREAISVAQDRGAYHEQRTILFVDEVHRFNKAQQDALLPWVENGTVIFIGATTENPYFEVNKALVSRSRIFQLTSLTADHLRQIVEQTLADPERGYGKRNVTIDDDALAHLLNVANGDARAVLNALELAVETTEDDSPLTTNDGKHTDQNRPSPIENRQSIHITLDVAEESIQQRAVLYDKEGDYHFDTISAFIKSVRGSDADAALYWMAKMLKAGEDPRFILRRMIILAGEDVGMADPNAIRVVMSCAEAFDRIGLPEGRFPLAQACLYLATAPKSNSTFALFDALSTVEQEADSGVPNHLRDGNRDKEGFGHGEGYLYPHAYRDHWVAQQYLPTSLQGKVFYQPSDQGYEESIRIQVARRREEQLAAMLDGDHSGYGDLEMLTFSPENRAKEQWLQRTISSAGEQLGRLRDRVLEAAHLTRHCLVLDLKAGSGLITWEALRQVPEGGVYALARTAEEADGLKEQTQRLPELERPILLQGSVADLPTLLEPELRFDAVVGHNVLISETDKASAVATLASVVAASGAISLAERVPRHTQRLYRLLDQSNLDADLNERLQQAEESIYADADDPLVNWDEGDLVGFFEGAGCAVETALETERNSVQVNEALLARWFAQENRVGKAKPSYAQRLQSHLSVAEVDIVRNEFEQQLVNQTVSWQSKTVYVKARLV